MLLGPGISLLRMLLQCSKGNSLGNFESEAQHFLVGGNQANFVNSQLTVQGPSKGALHSLLHICSISQAESVEKQAVLLTPMHSEATAAAIVVCSLVADKGTCMQSLQIKQLTLNMSAVHCSPALVSSLR